MRAGSFSNPRRGQGGERREQRGSKRGSRPRLPGNFLQAAGLVTSGLALDCSGGRRSPNREAQSRGDCPGKPASIMGPAGGIQSEAPRRPKFRALFSALPSDDVCTSGEGREVQEGSPHPSPARKSGPLAVDPPQPPNSICTGRAERADGGGRGALPSSGRGWEPLLRYSGVSLGLVRGWPAAWWTFLPGPWRGRRARSFPSRGDWALALILALKFPVGLELAAASQVPTWLVCCQPRGLARVWGWAVGGRALAAEGSLGLASRKKLGETAQGVHGGHWTRPGHPGGLPSLCCMTLGSQFCLPI